MGRLLKALRASVVVERYYCPDCWSEFDWDPLVFCSFCQQWVAGYSLLVGTPRVSKKPPGSDFDVAETR